MYLFSKGKYTFNTWLTVKAKSRQGSVSNKGQMKFNFSTATNSTISTTLFIEL